MFCSRGTSCDNDVLVCFPENFDVASFKGLPSHWRESSFEMSADGHSSKTSKSEEVSKDSSLSDHKSAERDSRKSARADLAHVRTVIISTKPAADSAEVTSYPGFLQGWCLGQGCFRCSSLSSYSCR